MQKLRFSHILTLSLLAHAIVIFPTESSIQYHSHQNKKVQVSLKAIESRRLTSKSKTKKRKLIKQKKERNESITKNAARSIPNNKIYDQYLSKIRNAFWKQLERDKDLRPNRRGIVMIKVEVQQEGNILTIKVNKSSGSYKLDVFTINSIKNITNIAEIPWKLDSDKVIFILPIHYL